MARINGTCTYGKLSNMIAKADNDAKIQEAKAWLDYNCRISQNDRQELDRLIGIKMRQHGTWKVVLVDGNEEYDFLKNVSWDDGYHVCRNNGWKANKDGNSCELQLAWDPQVA